MTVIWNEETDLSILYLFGQYLATVVICILKYLHRSAYVLIFSCFRSVLIDLKLLFNT